MGGMLDRLFDFTGGDGHAVAHGCGRRLRPRGARAAGTVVVPKSLLKTPLTSAPPRGRPRHWSRRWDLPFTVRQFSRRRL